MVDESSYKSMKQQTEQCGKSEATVLTQPRCQVYHFGLK